MLPFGRQRNLQAEQVKRMDLMCIFENPYINN